MGIHYGKADFINYGKPSLLLDFARNKSLVDRITGNNLITFTRASTGTYVGADGLIKTANADEPRFDHNPVTGESLGLLIEESRTNYVRRSIDFSNWGVFDNIVLTANSAISPDGTQNAYSLAANTVSGTHKFGVSSSGILSGSTAIATLYAKPYGSNTEFGFGIQVSGGTVYAGTFTLTGNGSSVTGFPATSGIGPSAADSTEITLTANGWYRCVVKKTLPANAAAFYIMPQKTATPYSGTGTDGVYIWGAQLEAGSFPTSYIPTSGSTVTRSADIASITGNNFSSWFGSTEGSILMNFKSNMLSSNDCVVLSFDDGSRYPWPIYRFTPTNDNYWKWYNGNDSIVNIKSGFSNSEYKFGFTFNQTNGSSAESGTLTQTDVTALRMLSKYASSNRMYIFRNIDDGFIATTTGTVNKLIVYPNKLSNNALQQLTQ